MTNAICRLVLFTTAVLVAAMGADWPRFRGPGGLATSNETGLPVTWSATKNVVWRVELPGAGTSSPITWGDRIYLTCYSGYAMSVDEPGDQENLVRHVLALDRSTGATLWKKDYKAILPESKYSGGNNTWHGYASSTPVVDGERLYVFFGRSGVYCFALDDGRELWHVDVGERTTGWGSTNSLLLNGDLLIVNASIESSSIRALNRATGEQVWTIEDVRGARNTPNLVELPGGGGELVVSMPGAPLGTIVGYDPHTGKELWRCRGIPDDGYVCPSPVTHHGVVFVIGGRKNTALAVRAGGRGDVTETHELWRTDKGANVAS
ncbi:MAG TPA: PQQ-binding-like beta-propeller repeat protein, partial [Pirellulales bacterium]|nr:PQQ-binding-like beta-propeller repeat protein [Pirellulales bacterium]